MAPQESVGFAEVQNCLINGGYFRARIQALPPFDVVAGGLAWCIRYSRFSVDVEFVENAEIRDKIKASENICKVLHDLMRCPHTLEPHQIQGLDYANILVVLKWLMKRVAATREENSFFVDQFTRQEFKRRFGCPLPGPSLIKRRSAIPPPNRVLISAKDTYENPVEHASAVLLEFGVQSLVKDSVLMLKHNAAELDGDAEAQLEHQRQQEEERKEAAMLDALRTQMVQHNEKQRMSSTSVNSVFAAADSNKLAKLRQTYEQRHAALVERLRQEEDQRNEIETQKNRIVEVQASVVELDKQIGIASAENEQYHSQCAEQRQQAEAAEVEMNAEEVRLDEIERIVRDDPKKSAEFDQLHALRASIDTERRSLKEQKASAKRQVAAMKEECEALAARLEALTASDHKAAQEAETTKYAASKKALQEKLREAVKETTQLLRKIDQYPTRLELKQYEARIDELNEEVAWKFEETKLMFAMHNTRTEVAKTLAGEQNVFETVSTAFLSCVEAGPKKSASQRSNLLEQLEAVVQQLNDAQSKQKSKLTTEQEQLTALRNQYGELMQQQKRYFDSIALFKEKAAVLADMTDEERKAVFGEEPPEVEEGDLADL